MGCLLFQVKHLGTMRDQDTTVPEEYVKGGQTIDNKHKEKLILGYVRNW